MGNTCTRPHNGLVELRGAAGLSQSGLAAAVGLHPSFVHLWETCQRPVPPKHLPAMARALNCSEAEVAAAVGMTWTPRPRLKRAPVEPRWIDPADPTGWRDQDDDAEDARRRYAAWAAREADLVVVAAEVRYRARTSVRYAPQTEAVCMGPAVRCARGHWGCERDHAAVQRARRGAA